MIIFLGTNSLGKPLSLDDAQWVETIFEGGFINSYAPTVFTRYLGLNLLQKL